MPLEADAVFWRILLTLQFCTGMKSCGVAAGLTVMLPSAGGTVAVSTERLRRYRVHLWTLIALIAHRVIVPSLRDHPIKYGRKATREHRKINNCMYRQSQINYPSWCGQWTTGEQSYRILVARSCSGNVLTKTVVIQYSGSTVQWQHFYCEVTNV